MQPRPSVLWLALLMAPSPAHAQGLNLIAGVREEAADTIADIAVTVEDGGQSVILFNPARARRLGPQLTMFFMAHEYGHIFHHHRKDTFDRLPDGERVAALQGQELEADCYAARTLGQGHREAPEAAIRFFTRLGPFQFDMLHPTGAQRAARIIACMPPGPPEPAGSRGDTGIEPGPVSGEPDRISFQVRTPQLSETQEGREVTLWLDGVSVGHISNMRSPSVLMLERFPAGIHSYRLQLEVYALDGTMQFSLNGAINGAGHIVTHEGDRFRVEWFPGEMPRLVREAE